MPGQRDTGRRDYSLVDRLLHRLALLPAVAELSFDLDQRASHARTLAGAQAARPHVFISGLARAGTTILLRTLHERGNFRSLTYRDMPFPLAPNLWRRASGRWRRDQAESERPHGDGIAVSADSPEALEELFWRLNCGPDYITRDALIPHAPDREVITRFRAYVAAILASGDDPDALYLSKNNNNILRLPALREAFPHAWLLIPIRDPAAHALSLWKQHWRFSALQAQDRFTRSYMDWLAHHEFGLGHRPFRLGRGPAPGLKPDEPDYWLDLWIDVHRALIEQADERTIFVAQEDLCILPTAWHHLAERIGVPPGGRPDFRLPPPPDPDAFEPLRLRRATALYHSLRELDGRTDWRRSA